MAQIGTDKAVQENKLELYHWADNVLKRIMFNFKRQMVWPFGKPGPYTGYRNTPAAKFSTGDGIRSLYARVYADANGDTDKIIFFFKEYLYFVDMGVGVGQDIDALDKKSGRTKNARYNRRYMRWDGEGDRQSRPILAMELRHQLRRLQEMLVIYNSERFSVVIADALSDEKDDGEGTKISAM